MGQFLSAIYIDFHLTLILFDIYRIQIITIIFLRIHLMRQNVLKRRAQSLAPIQASGEDSVCWIHPTDPSSPYTELIFAA